MADKILLRRGNRVNLPALSHGEPGFALDTGELYIGSPFGNVSVGSETRNNLNYFVDSTSGNDSNDGFAPSTALKSIQAALNRLPRFINHNVTINVVAGFYGTVMVEGFVGKGRVDILGATSISSLFVVDYLTVKSCVLPVRIRGFVSNMSAASAFLVQQSFQTTISYCRTVVSSSNPGFSVYSSVAIIENSEVSNRSAGILAGSASKVFSNTNIGTGNAVGLQSFDASDLGKFGSQPGGTTAESAYGGGVIR